MSYVVYRYPLDTLHMIQHQLTLGLDLEDGDPLLEILSPHDMWEQISQHELARYSEDRRIEFKSSSIHFAELAKYYSMFSNTSPEGGVILIGVNDNGVAEGCKSLSVHQLNALEKFHFDFCPEARPEVRRVELRVGGSSDFFLAFYVPYRNKLTETNKKEAYIRYGDSIHKMSDEEKREYRQSRNEIEFELEPCGLMWPDDFDAGIVSALCERFLDREDISDRSHEEILEIKHLGQINRNNFYPNKALAILAARDPRSLIPGCRIRIQRFEGILEGEGQSYNPVVDRFIEGNAVQLIERTALMLENLIYDFTWFGEDGKFVTTKEYPRAAWFEALVNAVAHRSYIFSGADISIKLFKDRMMIESPGGFCPPVSPSNIYKVRASRNPFLMDGMYLLDYVKMAREGTRRMAASMKEYGLPEPEFLQEAVHGLLVRVVLRNDSAYRRRAGATEVIDAFGEKLWKTFDDDEQKLAEIAVRNGEINVSDAQRVTGRTWHTAKKILTRMVQRGALIHVHNQSDRDSRAYFRPRIKVTDTLE